MIYAALWFALTAGAVHLAIQAWRDLNDWLAVICSLGLGACFAYAGVIQLLISL